jgi:F0F1-type ATP synthase membrane subunit b/b'
MKQGLTILRGIFAAVMLLGFATVALAEEEHASPAEHAARTSFRWIHFVIVAALLIYVFRVYGRPYFRRISNSIFEAIEKATEAKGKAERELKEAAMKLASLEQEVGRFRAQAQTEASAEMDRLRAMMKTDAEKVGLAAKAEVEAAERAARVELRALAAKLAVDRAESLVARQMTPAVQEAMLDHFVQSLQGRPN